MRDVLPDAPDLFLANLGMETDLIFTHGMELPGFASYPLLESDDGRRLLRTYLDDMIVLAKDAGTGLILESATWVANRDRGAALGYSPAALAALNTQAVGIMADARGIDATVVLSANIGPRADAYAPTSQMTVAEAETYHAEQIAAFVGTEVDVVSGYTLTYAAEAAGMVRAAKRADLKVVIAFTVETDGRLPTGMTLADAIAEVDAQTDSYAAYFMINCAHPEHFAAILEDAPWMARVQGIVANASRCSHAELDEAEELDDGNPAELGAQLAAMRKRFPQIRVLGGCCGTDLRHMAEIAKAAT